MSALEGVLTERRGSTKRRLLNQAIQHCSNVGGRVPDQESGVTQNESRKATGDMVVTDSEIAALSPNYAVFNTRTPENYWHTEYLQN